MMNALLGWCLIGGDTDTQAEVFMMYSICGWPCVPPSSTLEDCTQEATLYKTELWAAVAGSQLAMTLKDELTVKVNVTARILWTMVLRQL